MTCLFLKIKKHVDGKFISGGHFCRMSFPAFFGEQAAAPGSKTQPATLLF
jgi:hypothetical protein